MAGSVPTQARPAAHPRDSDAIARLALCETLLASDDAAECARVAVEWLSEHGGVRRAFCAVIDPAAGRLASIASTGVPASALEGFDIGLEEDEHPLVFALAERNPLPLDGDARVTRAMGKAARGDFIAVP